MKTASKSKLLGYKIKVKNLENNEFLYFDSIREAGRELNIGKTTISNKLLKNNYTPVKGIYIFYRVV